MTSPEISDVGDATVLTSSTPPDPVLTPASRWCTGAGPALSGWGVTTIRIVGHHGRPDAADALLRESTAWIRPHHHRRSSLLLREAAAGHGCSTIQHRLKLFLFPTL